MIPILLLMTLFLVVLGLFILAAVFTISKQLGRIEAGLAEIRDRLPASGAD